METERNQDSDPAKPTAAKPILIEEEAFRLIDTYSPGGETIGCRRIVVEFKQYERPSWAPQGAEYDPATRMISGARQLVPKEEEPSWLSSS